MYFFIGIFVWGWMSKVGCVPLSEENLRSVDTSFIGKGTNEIATALLQGYVTKEENMAYSPFGYSAILAIFSEGARGVSREEIANALHFPSDVQVVREAYRSVLERFVERKFLNSPEFKNWFYIYKNYTVEEDLQNVLRKYYLTEVKCVDRPEDYIKGTKKPSMKEVVSSTEKDVTEKSKLKSDLLDLAQVSEDTVKNEKPLEKLVQKTENSKSDQNSFVALQEKKKTLEKSVAAEGVTENSKYKGEENIDESKYADNESAIKDLTDTQHAGMAPNKASAPMELMPIEHFSGMTDSSLRIRGQESKSRMIIFNGLYYKGEWDMPFVKMPADDSRVFYKSDKEKIFVSTIHSQGVFNYGNVPSLDCRAIELPYKGGRYSLLILVPNSRDGLSRLISDLTGYSFKNIYDQMSEKLMDVCLPSFEIETLSKPISPTNKLGLNKVTSIFNPETADLTGISSKDAGLYVEELVQVVTFKVDADYSKANFITASVASSRSNAQSFQINQPFLFYLRDNRDDLIIVNGKVIDPTPRLSLFLS